MKLKIINLHILRYLPTCWLCILEPILLIIKDVHILHRIIG